MLTLEQQSETLSAATLWTWLHAGDIAAAILNHWQHPDHTPTVNSIHVPVRGAPPFNPPNWNLLEQDLPDGYVRVPLPRSNFFLRRECDGTAIGLEKFSQYAKSGGINHEREAWASLFTHSLQGPLKRYNDDEVFISTAPVPGNRESHQRESQGATLPERVFFEVIKTKKYRIKTMPNALYLTLVCAWTNHAAAEKYGLVTQTVKKNRAELWKKSGYENLDRLNQPEHAALGDSHEGINALSLMPRDISLGRGTDPRLYESGDGED